MTSFPDNNNVTTTVPSVEPQPDEEWKYLIIPIIVIVLVMLLSALVYVMVARKRKSDVLRHHIMALYEFDSNEQEWESFSNYDCPNYKSVDYSTSTL